MSTTICECCGQPDGRCPGCGRPHAPAVNGGREECHPLEWPRPGVLDHDRVRAAVEESVFDLGSPGFCIACGAERDGCEPDAQNYPCFACGKHEVYGAEELLVWL